MHHLCSETELAHFAGTSVERDFVEAPSQMLENWCYQPEIIDLMSSHYKDKTKLPADTLKRVVAAKDSSTGMFNTRQMVFALFDQTLHTLSDAEVAKVDCGALFAKTWNDLMGLHVTPGTNFAASFGHIAGGYEAQYYGYSWYVLA
jgi:thimet oligopeptidase